MIVVTAPTGLIGHQVLNNLLESDEPIRVIARDPSRLPAHTRERVEVVPGSHGDLDVVTRAFAGADSAGRVLMYAPSPFQGGSSVSHWDVSAFRNLLMEPNINGDLTHEVTPYDVREGALALQSAWRFFPPGSIHVAVIDPGVGSARRALGLTAGGHYFVGPDNGLFTFALGAPGWSAASIEAITLTIGRNSSVPR